MPNLDIVPPANHHWVELTDDRCQLLRYSLAAGEPVDFPTYRLHGLLAWPPIREQVAHGLGSPRMEMEPQGVESFLSHRHQAGLGRVELAFLFPEGQSDRASRVLGLEFGPAHNDESSRAGEFHPGTLTDPDVNVSAHPALIVQPPHAGCAGARTDPVGDVPHAATTVPPAASSSAGVETYSPGSQSALRGESLVGRRPCSKRSESAGTTIDGNLASH
jgi:hypothetical protein